MIDQLRAQYANDLVSFVRQQWPELPARKIVAETFRLAESKDWSDPRKSPETRLRCMVIDLAMRAEEKAFPLFQ
jgi:hypothetical protein